MGIFSKIYKVLNTPPEVTLNKAKDRIASTYKIRRDKASDLEKSSYQQAPAWFDNIAFNYFNLDGLNHDKEEINCYRKISERLLNHRFDLLGSGPVVIKHGMESAGFEGILYPPEIREFQTWFNERISTVNKEKSLEILDLISKDYQLIDWQIDFKSGFRWNELDWYRDIRWGHIAGADIKVPWELGRMQHLVHLAICCKLATVKEGFLQPEKYFEEFSNQIFDFIGSNPPRFGVQWMTPMEVGIRAVNWLIAYDLFSSIGYKFTESDLQYFIDSVNEHILHVLTNLEWSSGMRGNHYLANIMSVLIISAYLPVSNESTQYLAFGMQELISETLHQFNSDGTNFEASTSYHGFSLEMILLSYTYAMILSPEKLDGLNHYSPSNWHFSRRLKKLEEQHFKISDRVEFEGDFVDRIEKAFSFSDDIIRCSSTVPAIGDDDSGFILKFINNLNSSEKFHSSNHHVINFFGYLFRPESFTKKSLLQDFINKSNSELKPVSADKLIGTKDRVISYPDGGFYFFINDIYKVVIRCGPIGQLGKGGHSHNDQLSFTLDVKSLPFFVDPGTYVYSSLPEKRNLFRSTQSHNTIWIEGVEQNQWQTHSKDDLFWYIGDRTMSKPVKIEDLLFIGEQYSYNAPHTRTFSFRKDYLDIFDNCEDEREKNLSFHLHPDITNIIINNGREIVITHKGISLKLNINNSSLILQEYMYSPSYGVTLNSKKIVAKGINSDTHSKISVESY